MGVTWLGLGSPAATPTLLAQATEKSSPLPGDALPQRPLDLHDAPASIPDFLVAMGHKTFPPASLSHASYRTDA